MPVKRFGRKDKGVVYKPPVVKKFLGKAPIGFTPQPITPIVQRTPASFAAARSNAYTYQPPARSVGSGVAASQYSVGQNPINKTAWWNNVVKRWTPNAEPYVQGEPWIITAARGAGAAARVPGILADYGVDAMAGFAQQPINKQVAALARWGSRHYNPNVGYMQQNMTFKNPNFYGPQPHPQAWTMRNVGRAKVLQQKPTPAYGPTPAVPETSGVLSYEQPTEGGGGYGGGGGYDYGYPPSYVYPEYTYPASPFTSYQRGYPMRGTQAPATPQFRTAGQAQPTYINQNTVYPQRWMAMLVNWRV